MWRGHDLEAEYAQREARSEEREWYARVISASLYSSGWPLVFAGAIASGAPNGPGPLLFLAGAACLAAGWLTRVFGVEAD